MSSRASCHPEHHVIPSEARDPDPGFLVACRLLGMTESEVLGMTETRVPRNDSREVIPSQTLTQITNTDRPLKNPSVAGTAASPCTARAGRSARAHTAACRPFASTALETKDRHNSLSVTGIAGRAVHGLIAPEYQFFKLLMTLAAFIFENRHSLSPPNRALNIITA